MDRVIKDHTREKYYAFLYIIAKNDLHFLVLDNIDQNSKTYRLGMHMITIQSFFRNYTHHHNTFIRYGKREKSIIMIKENNEYINCYVGYSDDYLHGNYSLDYTKYLQSNKEVIYYYGYPVK